MMEMRLAIVASHPVQYYAPLFRTLARRVDLMVFYAHAASPDDQARAGFGVGFEWDVDLLSGYPNTFVTNVARRPGLGRFAGVDTPDIGRRLRQGGFDAVLITGWYLKCFIQALVAAKRGRIPVMARGDSHLGTKRSRLTTAAKTVLYPHFLRRFDAALVVGERNRAYWCHYGYPSARMFDSPHCVDNEWFARHATDAARAKLRERLGIGRETPVALFAGKLVDFKRPLDLLEAAGRARNDGVPVEVAIAGAGPLERALRDRAAEVRVPLHMLGFCNQTRMPEVYAASDLLVLPSSARETWGLVLNEALACDRPILVSDAAGSAPDMAKHLGKRSVFRSGDVVDLAGRMTGVLESPPAIDVLRRAAGAFALDAAASGIERATNHLRRTRAELPDCA